MNSLSRILVYGIVLFSSTFNASSQQNLASVEFDQPAVLKSCDPNWSHREINYCLSKKVGKLLKQVKLSKAEYKTWKNTNTKMYAKFTVSETGKVEDIGFRPKHYSFNKKFRKALKRLEFQQPAIKNEKPAEQIFIIPISLAINGTTPILSERSGFNIKNSYIECKSHQLNDFSQVPLFGFKAEQVNKLNTKDPDLAFEESKKNLINQFIEFINITNIKPYFESGENALFINFSIDEKGEINNVVADIDNRILKLYLENALKNIGDFSIAKVDGKAVKTDFLLKLIYNY